MADSAGSFGIDFNESMVDLELDHQQSPSPLPEDNERPSSQMSVHVHQAEPLAAKSPNFDKGTILPVSDPSISSSSSASQDMSPKNESNNPIFGDFDLSSPPQFSFEKPNQKLEKKIGLSCLPEQRQSFSQKLGGQFNLMVAGAIGLGKTTFINTLFNENLFDIHHYPSKDGLSITRFELLEQNFPLRLNIVESSGLGQHINNEGSWIPFANYIDDQFKTYLFQEQQPDRSSKYDNRIHCCIYFLPPNLKQVTPLDLNALKALTSRVNVIPVIGKSDCMNSQELKVYKETLSNYFVEHEIKFCDFLNDEELSMRINESLPYAIIGSNEVSKNNTRIRKYPWGTIEVNDPKYCQFGLLSRILIEENMLDFLLSTENHYEVFRNQFLEDVLTKNNTTVIDNGLEELKVYSRFTYKKYQESIKDVNNVLQYKEELLKAKVNEEIVNQEKRFKEWKKKLVAKQNELNTDIEDYHAKLIELQETVSSLEEGFGVGSNHHTTLSRSTFMIDDEITTGKNEMRLLSFPFH